MTLSSIPRYQCSRKEGFTWIIFHTVFDLINTHALISAHYEHFRDVRLPGHVIQLLLSLCLLGYKS